MNVLVTGGAGYIGSHAVKQLIEAGHHVVAFDNLSVGHRAAVHPKAVLVHADLADGYRLAEVLREHAIDGVMHFAALALVSESVTDPLRYYHTNTAGTLNLLLAMRDANVHRLVFSSTCATYGEPETMPIVETMTQKPINPYGWSKLFIEQILRDHSMSDSHFGFCALRYFNVAGSALDGSLGEDHRPETHLIPRVLAAALGKSESVTIFGSEYPTHDGTCVRDYIHVEDLCSSHLAALNDLEPGDAHFYNLGIGKGYSVKEVIESAKWVTGVDFKVDYGPARPGDPPVLYANADKIRNDLGWVADISDIDEIVASAWLWLQNHPNGYED